MSGSLYRAAIIRELARIYPDQELAELWWLHAGEFSTAALTVCRHALAADGLNLLSGLPQGRGASDSLDLLFFRGPQQLMAALVYDPVELWADLEVLSVVPAATLPPAARLLR